MRDISISKFNFEYRNDNSFIYNFLNKFIFENNRGIFMFE